MAHPVHTAKEEVGRVLVLPSPWQQKVLFSQHLEVMIDLSKHVSCGVFLLNSAALLRRVALCELKLGFGI